MDHTIRRARRKAGLSLRQLAARAGTSHSTLLAYEQGTKVPRADTRDRIIRAAGFVFDPSPVPRLSMTEHGEVTGVELLQVLWLAESFPNRRRDEELDAPCFPPRGRT